MELVTNIDIVVAAKSASFALPEVKRGVFAGAGALPRIVRTIGKQRAMEMVLTGRTVTAAEALNWGLVNAITDDAPIDAAVESRPVVEKALEYAAMITDNSPDSVVVSREGVKLGWEGLGAEEATRLLDESWGRRLRDGHNIKEGGESKDRFKIVCPCHGKLTRSSSCICGEEEAQLGAEQAIEEAEGSDLQTAAPEPSGCGRGRPVCISESCNDTIVSTLHL